MKKIIASGLILWLLTAFPLAALTSNSHWIDLERGSAQSLSITDASQTGLDFSGDLTFALRVRFETYDTGLTYVGKRLGTGNQRSYQFRMNTANTMQFVSFDDGDGSTSCNVQVTWSASTATNYMVSVTKSGTSVKFFVNGSQQGTTQTCSSSTIYNGTAPFEIGARVEDPAYLDGKIDDVRVWSRALSDSDISSLYSNPCTFDNGASLQGWWVLDNALTDSSGNGNTLTNNNSAVFATDTPYTCTAASVSTSSPGAILFE